MNFRVILSLLSFFTFIISLRAGERDEKKLDKYNWDFHNEESSVQKTESDDETTTEVSELTENPKNALFSDVICFFAKSFGDLNKRQLVLEKALLGIVDTLHTLDQNNEIRSKVTNDKIEALKVYVENDIRKLIQNVGTDFENLKKRIDGSPKKLKKKKEIKVKRSKSLGKEGEEKVSNGDDGKKLVPRNKSSGSLNIKELGSSLNTTQVTSSVPVQLENKLNKKVQNINDNIEITKKARSTEFLRKKNYKE